MATSGAMSTSNDKVKYTITITQNSQNVANNTSNVTVTVRFYRTNTGYTTYGSGTVSCKINGTTYTANVTSSQKITENGINLFSKTLNIGHNNDGTKTLTTSAWINLNTPLTSSEQSFSMTLTTIPRATTPTVSATSVNLGSSFTINLPRASSSFTHTLKYSFAGASGTIGSNYGTSATWVPPLSLASNIPNATSGTCTIACDTYNGSTKIGSKNITVKLAVPSSVVPTISAVNAVETVSGLAAKIGAFVQGQSQPKITITAAGDYGSTISTYISTVGSSSFNGASFTISNLNQSGTVPIQVTVTDSRGRKATKTQNITVLAYSIPQITAFSGIRCDASGNADDEGQYVALTYAYTISALNNKNDKSATVQYQPVGASSWTNLFSESNYNNSATHVSTVVFNADNSFKFKLTLADCFKTVTITAEVTTAFTLLDFSAGGKGVGIGKVAETENLLDIGLPVSFSGSGWNDLTLTSNFMTHTNDLNQPQYKAIGELVFIRGAVTPISAFTSSSAPVTIATGLPAALRPPYNMQFVCQGSGMNRWLCSVTTAGAVAVSRYGISENANVPLGAWLPFAISYMV